jgi:hypothetical protein
MERSEQVGDLVSALAKAQAEFTYAAKDSKNPAFNSSYADLASVITAVRPALSKHGIAFLQFDESDVERQTASVTTSFHHGEQWISMTAEAPAVGLKGFNVQSLGACWTYLRRYTLQALSGLASDDDDGNSLAIENKPTAKKQPVDKVQPPVSPANDERTGNWLQVLKSCPDYREFKDNVLPIWAKSVEAVKEFLMVSNGPILDEMFRILSDLESFNEVVIPLNKVAYQVRRPFIQEVSAEATRRGYISSRTTGLYEERKAS